MPIMMESPTALIKNDIHIQQEPQTHVKDESNNNDSTNGTMQSVYDVVGTNDQELARRQYVDDGNDNLGQDEEEEEEDDEQDCLSRHKRLATEANVLRRASSYNNDQLKATTMTNGCSKSSVDENDCLSQDSTTNGYPNELENSNDNLKLDNDQYHQQQQQTVHSDEPEQMRKLFIGGLDYKTSEETLKQHFEKFGDVLDCVVMREPQSKRSRGFGFVIYANSNMVDRAQVARPHEVDGREVQSKRAISREDSGKPEAQATVKKVYLGGISDDIKESDLRDYFSGFGNIVNVNIVAHKDTGKRRGFAFVEYDDYDPVDKIVLKKYHTIKDKRIEAKKAIPKIEMDARKRGDPRNAMANAMIALSGPPIDGPNARPRLGRNGAIFPYEAGPYGAMNYPPGGYSNQDGLDNYPPHYHSPSAHYGSSNWLMHGYQGGSPYGFRGSGVYGRSNFANQASGYAANYGGFPGAQGGAGPVRVSYQHRGWGPYGSGYGTHRGRGFNP